ncbi:sortase [Candidatus Gracilibacteria bacterium]|nr:sortase [Candidatus Gracilibacteria bacterium]
MNIFLLPYILAALMPSSSQFLAVSDTASVEMKPSLQALVPVIEDAQYVMAYTESAHGGDLQNEINRFAVTPLFIQVLPPEPAAKPKPVTISVLAPKPAVKPAPVVKQVPKPVVAPTPKPAPVGIPSAAPVVVPPPPAVVPTVPAIVAPPVTSAPPVYVAPQPVTTPASTVRVNGPILKALDAENVGTYYLSVPSVGIKSLPVNPADATVDSLWRGVLINGAAWIGHRPETPHKTVIFAHSSNFAYVKSAYNEAFRYLHNVKIGDTASIVYQGRTLNYVVKKKEIVPATTASIVTDYNREELVLFTCWPYQTSKDRYIVYLDRI